MEIAVTKLAIICFFVTGVSHILQPRVWAQFFIDMHDKGAAGSFLKWLYYKIIRKKDYPALSAESPGGKDMTSFEDIEVPRSGDTI